MAHPLSIFSRCPRFVDRRCFVETVWLVCEWQAGRWWPMQDHPPAYDEAIAIRYAEKLTEMRGRRCEARPFSIQPARTRGESPGS